MAVEKKKIVIALGGNALGKDIEEQKEAVAKTAKVIVDLAQEGYSLIVTHGNGPQVGMIQDAMDSLRAENKNYKKVPLPTCVAMSQGYIGIDLQNAIKYELFKREIDGKVSTILSQKMMKHLKTRPNLSAAFSRKKRRWNWKRQGCTAWKTREEDTVSWCLPRCQRGSGN